MKILICSANYAPELTGVGKYSGEMAQWLAAQGHEVRVVAAPPYYPAWQVDAAYRGRGWFRERVDRVQVWRVPIWVPKRPSGLQRVLHLMSFGLSSLLPLLFWALVWRPDMCLCVAPFVTSAPGVWFAARLGRSQAWLHLQDFEVDVAFRIGLLRGGLMQRAVSALERWVMRRFDRVSSISQRMLERAAEKGVDVRRLVMLRNWVDVDSIQPLAGPSIYRAELDIPQDALVVLFAGTLGLKQGLQLLPPVARQLANLHFVVCGHGPMKATLLAECADLGNVHFMPLQPVECLSELLGLADIHLLTQDPAAEDLVLPSKLGGMLASGRPVVATVRLASELGCIVADCGLVVEPGSADALAAGLQELVGDAARRRALGLRGRRFAEEHLGREGVLLAAQRAFSGQSAAAQPVQPQPGR